MSTEIRVALVFEQDAGTQALRTALANAGVTVAVECRASALESSPILGAAVDAIVVNLDPELENLLDEVTEALDAATQPVIYNDPAASSDLSGWDRARWMRHLSAKLKGQSNVTPPPPPGAQPIPMPVVRAPVPAPVAVATAAVAAHVDVALPSAVADAGSAAEPATTMAAPIAAPAAPQDATLEIPFDLGLADLDLMFDEPAAAQPAQPAPPATSLTMGEDLGDLDALFAESPAVDFEPEAEAGAANAAGYMDEMRADSDGGAEIDLDSLFSEAPGVATEPAAPVTTESELTDLDALFREFETSHSAEVAAADAAAKAPPGAPERAAVEPKGAPADWSLEPLQELTLDDLETGGAPAAAPASPSPAARTPSGPVIPAELEASLALADLKLLDDEPPPAASPPPAQAQSQPTGLADFDSLDFSSMDLESIEPAAATPANSSFGDELSLADLDFDLTPDQGNAPAGVPSRMQSSDEPDLGAIGDLDSLFEPSSEAPVFGLSLPDLDRVFILGASIGGPEAIKLFLSQLPTSVPAAFIVAQHMGGEFLEMMAVQLDTASPLPVRCPKAGERLRHGEVIVAPANEQLSIDDSGCVQLSAAASGSPYNPSIDHLVHAAADRFGDHATLILFSGMGSDAVEGGRYLTSRGGQVWAQDRASCVIASMIDSAKSQGLIRFEGTPAQLAERVLQVVS